MKGTKKRQRDLISDIDKASNSKELLEILDRIAAFGQEESTGYLESGNYAKAVLEYDLIASAYSHAAELIADSSRFQELKTVSSSFRLNAQYWKNQGDASLREGIEKYRNKAYNLQQSGHYREAIENLNKILELDPSDSNTWNDKGVNFFSIRDYQQASHSYEKAIELNSNNVFAWTNLGLIYKDLSNYEKAIECFNKAIKINPDFEKAFLSKGEVYFRTKRYKDAKDAYTMATKINNQSANAWHDLGVTLIEGYFEYKTAREYIERALELQPDSLGFKADLAEVLLHLKDYSESEKLASEVIDNSPDENCVYGMRLILVVSAYLRNSLSEGMEAASDLIKYYKSVSSKHEFSWLTNALKKTINESSLDPELKEVLLKLTSLHETSIDSDRNLVADDIRFEMLTATMASKGRSYLRTLTDIQKKIRSAFGARSIDAEEIIIDNESSPNPTQPGYYNWEIFLDVPESVLSQIDNVKYTLHPTFTEREVTINTEENGFRLRRMGWGEFNVKIEVNMKDGRTITKYHWLNLTGARGR